MDVQIRRVDEVTVVTCSGQMTHGTPQSTLRDGFIEELATGQRAFVIDLLAVPYMDTPTLGEVIACWKRAAEAKGGLKLVVVPGGRVGKLLALTGLDKVFQLFADTDTAVASF